MGVDGGVSVYCKCAMLHVTLYSGTCVCVHVHTCVHIHSESRGFWLWESGQLALPRWLPTDPSGGQQQGRACHLKVETGPASWEDMNVGCCRVPVLPCGSLLCPQCGQAKPAYIYHYVDWGRRLSSAPAQELQSQGCQEKHNIPPCGCLSCPHPPPLVCITQPQQTP